MNFTEIFLVIPFFLATKIVFDADELLYYVNLGPEYIFNLQVTTETYMRSKQVQYKDVFSTLKCRPKMSDSLLCHLQYFKTFDEQIEFDESDTSLSTSAIFEMKFNESGVERILTNSSDPFKRELMQKIAKQLSTGIDVQRNFNGSSINYSIDKTPTLKCRTTYNITYLEPKIKMAKRNTNFQFAILPMFVLKPDSIFMIRNLAANCEYNWVWTPWDTTSSAVKYSGAIQINDKFESWTEFIDSKIKFNRQDILQTIYVKETIRLSLESVKPAQCGLVNIFNGSWFSPHINFMYKNMPINMN
ncbi:uncharacterized protein [Linepithema humile]|uniref:uncharacterized protein n=1 Tax=Linepithema humile TaxID=83485 RepID=UPI000623A823|nr:PREDICTED: uncharacterized protein LOC105671633 [Linepithema humile]